MTKYARYTMFVASLIIGAVVAVAQLQPSSNNNAASLTKVDQFKAQSAVQFKTPELALALKASTQATPKARNLVQEINQSETSPPEQPADQAALDMKLAENIPGLADVQASMTKSANSLDNQVKQSSLRVVLWGGQFPARAVLTGPGLKLRGVRLDLNNSQAMEEPAKAARDLGGNEDAALNSATNQSLGTAVLLNKDLTTHAALIVPGDQAAGAFRSEEARQMTGNNVNLSFLIQQHSLQHSLAAVYLGEVRVPTTERLPQLGGAADTV